MKTIKKKVFDILEPSAAVGPFARGVSLFLVILISLNVLAVISETVKTFYSKYSEWLYLFEILSVSIFTIEYILRLWSSNCDQRHNAPVLGRIRFALTPLAFIDLLAILPFYLPMILPLDLRFIRALRLVRIARIFKMGRYSSSLKTLMIVLRDKKEEMLITVFAVIIVLVFASSLMYHVENESQPEAFSSIPAAMWWGVATLTTVGYGDIYPITPLGKFLGALIALLGIGLFALPAGILSSGFIEEIQKRRENTKYCPHCGKAIGE